MTRVQRAITVAYCIMVVYCCVWIPWRVISPELGPVHLGYAWLWSGPAEHGLGGPDIAAIALRLVAATALGIAAFLLSGKWKVLLSVATLAALGFAGFLLYNYWTTGVTERQIQKIHDCAVAKVATAEKCPPPSSKGDIFDQVCGLGELSDNPTAQDEDEAIAVAEKECASQIAPKRRSAHEQIEEYKRQHGIKK